MRAESAVNDVPTDRGNTMNDTGVDTGVDAAVDTGTDAGTDVADDVQKDTGTDVVIDDVPMDTGTDVTTVDVTADVGVDVGMDVGMDVAMDVAADVAPDVSVVDVAMDVPMGLCASAIDLNTAGTVSGATTSYTGNNSSAPMTAAVLPMGCTTNTGAQVVHTYTTTSRAALRISVVDPTTSFDTVALAISGCGTGPTELGCNDDFTGLQSQFTTAPVAAGSTIVILIGGYNSTSPATGTYVLHVTELLEVALGGTCDPAGTANLCVAGASCITSGGASTCVADGTTGGRCRGTGTACDAPNVCNGSATSSTSRCVPVIAIGGACDATGATNVCDPTGHCITSGTSSTCVLDGTAGGRCRATGTACDAPNVCNGSATSSTSRCVPVIAIGGACDATGATNVCDPTGHCITSGGTSTCIADGALGGRCRGTGTACDAPNACNGSATSTTSRCVTVVALGGTCDPAGVMNVCATGSHCGTSGGVSTCTTTPPYTESTTPPMCDDLSSVGTAVPGATGDDAASAIIPLPFSFSFFGSPVDGYSVTTNGFMQVWSGTTGTPSTAYSNVAIPATGTPNNFIAPFWDDMLVNSPSVIRAATLGTAPTRRFVVEWNAADLFSTTGSVLTYQAQLFEGTNVIEFHYCTLMPAATPATSGSSATVGLENPMGTIGVQHSYNTAGSVSTTTAIRFTPAP